MDVIQNPLADDGEAADLARKRAIDLKAATAKTAADWIDIYKEVVYGSVQSVLEKNGQGSDVSPKLAEYQGSFAAVRDAFSAQGLDLNEEVDWQGPVPIIDPKSNLIMGLEWPHGQEVTFFWPNGERLTFRGQKALVAVTFIMWWANFQPGFAKIQGKEPEGQRRLIEPGSPDWHNYMKGRPKG
jgi:hypothetical protein